MIRYLSLGEDANGYVASHDWNYYKILTSTENNLVVSVTTLSDSGDCDLYLRKGSDPTRSEYDAFDYSTDFNFSVSVSSSGLTEWHIGVFGATPCEYALSTSLETACPANCNAREQKGSCVDGHCQCTEGWIGEDCSSAIHELRNGVEETARVTFGKWTYFKFVSNGSVLVVEHKDTNGDGVAASGLYVSEENYPTLLHSLASDARRSSTSHHVVLTRTHTPVFSPISTYFLGVYSFLRNISSSANESSSYPFKIVAWNSPF